MLTIPFKALKIGGEAIHQNPVKYNKSRISGSKKTTYTLHIRGASMPGRKDIFTTGSSSKPPQLDNLLNKFSNCLGLLLDVIVNFSFLPGIEAPLACKLYVVF